MAEDGGDGEAAGALDVHEEGAGGGDESLIPFKKARISNEFLHVCGKWIGKVQ